MFFKIESIKGCKRLWVVAYTADGKYFDCLPVMHIALGLERRVKRKIRRLVRMYNKRMELTEFL